MKGLAARGECGAPQDLDDPRPAGQSKITSGSGDIPFPGLAAKFPTAALATLELDRPWPDVAPGCATLTAFVKPKELAGKATT